MNKRLGIPDEDPYFIDQIDLPRCPRCTLRPPCAHLQTFDVMNFVRNKRINLPRNPDAPPCYSFEETGNCLYGQRCKFDHDPAKVPLPDLERAPERCLRCTAPKICYRHDPPLGKALTPEDDAIKTNRPTYGFDGQPVPLTFSMDEIVAVPNLSDLGVGKGKMVYALVEIVGSDDDYYRVKLGTKKMQNYPQDRVFKLNGICRGIHNILEEKWKGANALPAGSMLGTRRKRETREERRERRKAEKAAREAEKDAAAGIQRSDPAYPRPASPGRPASPSDGLKLSEGANQTLLSPSIRPRAKR